MENPKNVDVKVRFTEETNKKLLHYAKEHNLTRAETIRLAVDELLSQQ